MQKTKNEIIAKQDLNWWDKNIWYTLKKKKKNQKQSTTEDSSTKHETYQIKWKYFVISITQ